MEEAPTYHHDKARGLMIAAIEMAVRDVKNGTRWDSTFKQDEILATIDWLREEGVAWMRILEVGIVERNFLDWCEAQEIRHEFLRDMARIRDEAKAAIRPKAKRTQKERVTA